MSLTRWGTTGSIGNMKLHSLSRVFLLAAMFVCPVVWRGAAEESDQTGGTGLNSATIGGSAGTSVVLPTPVSLAPPKTNNGHNRSGIEGRTQIVILNEAISSPPSPGISLPPLPTINSMLIHVYSRDFELLQTSPSDANGAFKIALKPGSYQIYAEPPVGNFPLGVWSFPGIQTVIVRKKEYASMYFEATLITSQVGF
jgi:hypothetical protein